jgi:hypothetical protein
MMIFTIILLLLGYLSAGYLFYAFRKKLKAVSDKQTTIAAKCDILYQNNLTLANDLKKLRYDLQKKAGSK